MKQKFGIQKSFQFHQYLWKYWVKSSLDSNQRPLIIHNNKGGGGGGGGGVGIKADYLNKDLGL